MLNWLTDVWRRIVWRRIGHWVHGEKLPQAYHRSNLHGPPPLVSRIRSFVVGQTPSSAPDPRSGFARTINTKADEGVGRRPGGPPHIEQFVPPRVDNPRQRCAKATRNAAISSPLRTSSTSPASTG